MPKQASEMRPPNSPTPKIRMPSALPAKSSGGAAVKRRLTVTSNRLSERAMSRARSASLSSHGSQNPKEPRRGRINASAKSATHQPGGTRRNLSTKLMALFFSGLTVAAAAL